MRAAEASRPNCEARAARLTSPLGLAEHTYNDNTRVRRPRVLIVAVKLDDALLCDTYMSGYGYQPDKERRFII